jgi:hypothetical protein
MHAEGGMLDFLDTDPGWLHKYVALLLLLLLLIR